MPRRPTRAVPTVILYGWQGSGPDHWQTWLAGQLRDADREVRYPKLPDPDHPELAAWLAALRDTLAGLADDGFDVVAHSLGAVLWLHHAASEHAASGTAASEHAASGTAAAEHAASGTAAPRPARVVLVAPPSPATDIPEIAPFFPAPLDIDAVRRAADGTVLVGSDNDPYTPEGIANAYGRPLKMPTTIVAGGGHLNAAAGYGEWPAMLDWCRRDNLAFIA
jgi:predicted alpha/beta hydrolase family esterase